MDNLPARINPVDIPVNMTPDDYREMKILPGHRIGFDYKQIYLTKLGDLYTQGYLTSEEYDKRLEWVNNAQTSEQIDLAFLDLQHSVLQLKVDQYLKGKQENKDHFPVRIIATITFILLAVNIILSGFTVGDGIPAAEILLCGIIIIKGIRRITRKD